MDSIFLVMFIVSEMKCDDVVVIGSEVGGNFYGFMVIKSNLVN